MIESVIILAVFAMQCRYAYMYAPPSLKGRARVLYSCIPLVSLIYAMGVVAYLPHAIEEWPIFLIGSLALPILAIFFVGFKTLRSMARARGKTSQQLSE